MFPTLWKKLSCYYMPSAAPSGASGQKLTDLSGYGRHSTGGTAASLNQQGRVGMAMGLDGTNVATVTSFTIGQVFPSNPTTEKTFMAWVFNDSSLASPVKAASYDGAAIMADSGGYYWVTRATVGGLDRIWVGNWDGNEDKFGITYTVDTWTHICYVHARGNIYGYKNGVLQGSVASGATGSTTGTIRLGVSWNAATKWKGLLDDIRFYDRRLDDSEIAMSAAGATPLHMINHREGWGRSIPNALRPSSLLLMGVG